MSLIAKFIKFGRLVVEGQIEGTLSQSFVFRPEF